MTRRITGLVLAMVALASCTQSRVDPNARVEIGGTLYRQNGTPVTGTSISLGEGPDAVDVFSTITTVGLACLTEELPNACDRRRVTTTGDDGRFVYEMKGSDTQGFFGNASTLELSTHLPRSGEQVDGPSLTMRFQVQTERLNLPLRFWEPRLKVTGDAREGAATWSRLPENILPPQGSLANVRSTLRFSRGPEPVWTYSMDANGGRFDPRYLEDTSGSVAVVAEENGVDVGDTFGNEIDVIWRSARFPYVSPVGAPVSRNAVCYVYDAKRKPVSQAGCRATDGRFDNELQPQTCPAEGTCTEPRHTGVYLDLGSKQPIRLVVIRQCSGRCVVEVSNNTKRWTVLGSGADGQEFIGMTPAGDVRARYVRVRSDDDLSMLAEVSVWNRARGRSPAAPPTTSLITSLSAAKQSPLSSGGGSGGFPWKIVLLACAVVGIATVAFMLGRAKRA